MKSRRALLTADDLIGAGLVRPGDRAALGAVGQRYAIALTSAIAGLVASNDDPIARQFIPDVRELSTLGAESADPIGDAAHSPVKGIVHRYDDRALFKIASACPVYCRFCFRREMVGPGKADALSRDDFDRALDYLRATPAIREVILTGGDPLALSPRRMRMATEALSAIPHVATLRWHTRVPVVDPERISDDVIAALTATDRPVRIAIHANHAREFTREACAALARIRKAGIALISQSVLLKNVNDDADALAGLMRAFTGEGVCPYYLHQGDLAPGTAHFRTTIARGRAVMRKLAARIQFGELPRYMLDIPGGFGKIDLLGDGVTDLGGGAWRITDRFGVAHLYLDATER